MCKCKFLYNCSWSIGLYCMHADIYIYYFTQLKADESIIYIIHHKYRKTISECYACQFLWAFYCTLNFGSCFGARVDFWRRRRWGCRSMQLKWRIMGIFPLLLPLPHIRPSLSDVFCSVSQKWTSSQRFCCTPCNGRAALCFVRAVWPVDKRNERRPPSTHYNTASHCPGGFSHVVLAWTLTWSPYCTWHRCTCPRPAPKPDG